MRVSVVLCTYNGGSFLSDQLASLREQKRQPDELVIGDDGSTDNTPAIVAEFARSVTFPVIWHVNDQRLGSTKNFELTAGRCTGNLIAFCDQDDVWSAGKLERAERDFIARPALLGRFSDATLVDDRLNPTGETLWQSLGFGAALQSRLADGRACRDFLRKNYVTGATLVIRRKLLEMAAPFYVGNPSFLHDRWLGLVAMSFDGLLAVPSPEILYRQHAAQQIGTVTARQISRIQAFRARMTPDRSSMLTELRVLDALQARLGSAANPGCLAELRDRTDHLAARTRLAGSKLAGRFSAVSAEYATGRYHRQGGGLAAALKDLVL